MVAGLQEHRWSQYTSYSRTTWLTRVCQFAGKHISPHQGEQISPGAWLGICVRGNRKSGGTHISATPGNKVTEAKFSAYKQSLPRDSTVLHQKRLDTIRRGGCQYIHLWLQLLSFISAGFPGLELTHHSVVRN